MIQLETYTTDLINREGIFFSKSESKISYPDSGNDHCFQIEENSFWFNHRNNCISEAVIKYCPNNVFFDIGGGNGFVTKKLEEKGISTVLLEPGIQGCINARKRNLKTIVCSTLENASFKSNTIPSVGLFDVVEHIENDVEFLATIYKYMKDDGYIFITVPAFQSLWSNDDVYAGHFRRYTINEIETKLKSIGFKIEYSTYIFSILVAAVFFFRAVPSKFGFHNKVNDPSKHKQDHSSKNGVMDKLLNLFWRFELKKIKQGKPIPMGGSCFVIARKIPSQVNQF